LQGRHIPAKEKYSLQKQAAKFLQANEGPSGTTQIGSPIQTPSCLLHADC